MKQIYALNVCRSARCWLHLMLVVWCGAAAAKSPVRDSAALRLPVQTDRVAAGDLVITASQIRAVDPVDLWKAISFYDPSISNSWERERLRPGLRSGGHDRPRLETVGPGRGGQTVEAPVYH